MTKNLALLGPAALAALCALGPAAAAGAPAATATPVPIPTAPPEIYHVITRPICAELQRHVVPAIGMLLEDDRTIAKSPPIFKRYNQEAFISSDPKSPYDSTNYDSAGRTMALQNMEMLVPTLAQNVIAIQKAADAISTSTGIPEDDKRLALIHAQLLQTVALQSASLDLINGFVTTEQMGDVQHAGEEYLSGVQNSGTTLQAPLQTPAPLQQDPNQPGLSPNPYAVDVAAMPGLSVGYNPVSRIVTVLQTVRQETAQSENGVARSVSQAAALCGVRTAPASSKP